MNSDVTGSAEDPKVSGKGKTGFGSFFNFRKRSSNDVAEANGGSEHDPEVARDHLGSQKGPFPDSKVDEETLFDEKKEVDVAEAPSLSTLDYFSLSSKFRTSGSGLNDMETLQGNLDKSEITDVRQKKGTDVGLEDVQSNARAIGDLTSQQSKEALDSNYASSSGVNQAGATNEHEILGVNIQSGILKLNTINKNEDSKRELMFNFYLNLCKLKYYFQL